MQIIQKDFEISDNAKWEKLYKKDVESKLNSRNNLLVTVCKTKLYVTYSYDDDYYIETYNLTSEDDFGDSQWQKIGRYKASMTEALKSIERGCKTYILVSGNWSNEFSSVRKINKEQNNFIDITDNFKEEFLKKFKSKYLYDNSIKADSLTIFDKYLAEFEDVYSDKYKEYLNLPIMIERWTREKIMTAFLIYIYSNKLINL